MKKKILSLCFAVALILPCLILLSGCDDKKVQSITVDDLSLVHLPSMNMEQVLTKSIRLKT